MVAFPESPSDTLHRAVKMALDSGEVATLDEAYALFRGYRLTVAVGPDVGRSATLQAAVLTIVNTARRCFLGGVQVIGNLELPLLASWRECRTLGEAVEDLGGVTKETPSPDAPLVVVGDAPIPPNLPAIAVRPTFQGWAAGVAPLSSGRRLGESQEFVPSGIFSGALAVSEAFQHVRGGNATAGRREIGLSLWRPEPEMSWLSESAVGPPLRLLPTKLWLIGLGHLGQAFLWTLGFLPYADPDDLTLVLQDFDSLVEANDSTSPLTHRGLLGQKKTRAMAAWAEARGFRTAITERRFTARFRVDPDEPGIALCGVDNPQARAALEEVGFHCVIEAGLGKGTTEYLAFQVHGFPGPQKARDVWSEARVAAASRESTPARAPAYAALAARGLDDCGITILAGRSVGASFVGSAVSALVIADVLRGLEGGPAIGLMDGSLRALERRAVITGQPWPQAWNPGYCLAGGSDGVPRRAGALME